MEERIPSIVKKEFNAQVLEMKRITEGFSHFMYDVKIDQNPYEIIIRFSENIKEDISLAKEKFVIETLRYHGIPAPKVFAFHFPENNKKEGYMILEKFKDQRLDTIWESLSKEQKIQITKQMGELAKKIHSIKFQNFGYIEENGSVDSDTMQFKFRSQGEEPKFNLFLRQILVNNFRDFGRLLSHTDIEPGLFTKITHYSALTRKKIEYHGEPALVHGDFIPGHIFVERINNDFVIKGIIDFEFAAAYHPEYDFIKLHRLGFFNDPELHLALETGYGKKIDKEVVEVFRFSRDVSFARVLRDSGNKEFSNKILKDVEKFLDEKLKTI